MAKIGFQLDEHMPHAVAEAMRRHGVDAETSSEAGLLSASDPEQIAYARRHGRMVVTQDRDFLILNASGIEHGGIAFCSHDPHSIGHIGHLVEALLLVYAIYEAEEMVGRVEYI